MTDPAKNGGKNGGMGSINWVALVRELGFPIVVAGVLLWSLLVQQQQFNLQVLEAMRVIQSGQVEVARNQAEMTRTQAEMARTLERIERGK